MLIQSTSTPTTDLPDQERRLPPPVLVDTPAAFNEMLAALAHEPVIALDTEADSLYRYFYKVCVIQISTPGCDYIVDPLRLPSLAQLGPILADPAVVKIFHAAENDILMLKRDFAFEFANVFDTMLAARILGWPQVGLAALVKQHFGIELDKRSQLTDWGQRPLSAAQLSYARLDSHFLFDLRARQVTELQARRRWREAQEAFAGLPQIAYVEKSFDPDGFWRLRGTRDLDPSALAVLRELYLWRDEQARHLNRPAFKVLSDDVLIQLSQRQPQNLADLGLSPRQTETCGRSLLTVINRGRRAVPPLPPAKPHNGNGRPDPAVQARFDRLRAWRTRRASERAVDADIVLTNEALMAIARAAPASPETLAALGVMGPWKLQEYGPDLLSVLAE